MFAVRIGTIAALTATLPAGPLMADITSADVWNNSSALIEALGGSHEAEFLRDGDSVTIRGHNGSFVLPMGAGRITFGISDYTMTEEAGTVTVTYPAGMEITLGASITGEGDASMTMRTGDTAISTLATGDPGAVSYVTQTGPFSLALTDFTVSSEPSSTAEFEVDIDGYAAETRIVEDTLVVVFSQSEIGRTTTTSTFSDGFGFETATVAETGPSTNTFSMGLIPGGADLLNLSGALRNGMYITAESSAQNSTSQSRTTIDGRLEQEDFYDVERASGTFALDRTQLAFGVDVGPGIFEMAQEFMTPRAFGIDFQGFHMDIGGPILRSDETQPFRIGFGLDDLRLGPTIWALFDPDKALPRGPASLDLSMTGDVILDADLPDFLALPELGGRQDASVQVTEVEIERFGLSALGVTADSSGAFKLDYGEYSVFPGVPWPEGAGRAEIKGLNGLLDALIDEGLIPSEEAFGLRLMISLGTIVAGDDILSSEIEFTEDGRIIANGQPFNLP